MRIFEGDIIDPAAFFVEHAGEIVTDESQFQHVVFGGDDLDVLVRGPLIRRDKIYSVSAASPILGDHYLRGKQFPVVSNGKAYRLEWFSSPASVNGMLATMGYLPGVDCPRVVRAEREDQMGTVHASDYVGYILRNELPRSEGLFIHDAMPIHLLGRLLMPPRIIGSLQTDAANADSYRVSDPDRFIKLAKKVTKESDALTELVHRMAKVYLVGGTALHATFAYQPDSNKETAKSDEKSFARRLGVLSWGSRRSNAIAEHMNEHLAGALDDLNCRLEKLGSV